MKRAKAISAFYRILGQSFEALKQLGFGKMRRISGKRLLIRGDTNPGGGLVQSSKFEVQRCQCLNMVDRFSFPGQPDGI